MSAYYPNAKKLENAIKCRREKEQKMNGALLSSKKMDYCTPQGFFDTLNAEFHFTLDAAATEKKRKMQELLHPGNGRLDSSVEYRGQCVLQPAVWPSAWGMGTQSL